MERIMTTRIGDWTQTFTGRVFWPMDPRADEIHIEDVAHALSNLCRFGGHTRCFYSVGEHSVRVSYACDPDDALWGLLHDASEAYLVDVPRPIKRYLSDYGPIETRLMGAVVQRFGLVPEVMPASVYRADEEVLATEARDLMQPQARPWNLRHQPLPDVIVPMSPGDAKDWFLHRFAELVR